MIAQSAEEEKAGLRIFWDYACMTADESTRPMLQAKLSRSARLPATAFEMKGVT